MYTITESIIFFSEAPGSYRTAWMPRVMIEIVFDLTAQPCTLNTIASAALCPFLGHRYNMSTRHLEVSRSGCARRATSIWDQCTDFLHTLTAFAMPCSSPACHSSEQASQKSRAVSSSVLGRGCAVDAGGWADPSPC